MVIGTSAGARYVEEKKERLELGYFLQLLVPSCYDFHFSARPCSDSNSALLIGFGCSTQSPAICTNCSQCFRSRGWVSRFPQYLGKQRLGEVGERSGVILFFCAPFEAGSRFPNLWTQKMQPGTEASELETGMTAMRPIALHSPC